MAKMFRPTEAMSNNARRGLEMRSKSAPSNQGGTSVGLARARQFAERQPVSLDIVKRTYSFLMRARSYYRPNKNTPGTQAYLLWGGPAGLTWARAILTREQNED